MIRTTPIPKDSLLASYAQRPGCYTDAFSTRVPTPVALPELVIALFNSPLFRLERLVLRWLAKTPTSDAEVHRLAEGTATRFALWRTEQRTPCELLLAVDGSPIRTWFRVEPLDTQGARVLFGSAVLPQTTDRRGAPQPGWAIRATTGVHRLYSRLLLWSAARKLRS